MDPSLGNVYFEQIDNEFNEVVYIIDNIICRVFNNDSTKFPYKKEIYTDISYDLQCAEGILKKLIEDNNMCYSVQFYEIVDKCVNACKIKMEINNSIFSFWKRRGLLLPNHDDLSLFLPIERDSAKNALWNNNIFKYLEYKIDLLRHSVWLRNIWYSHIEKFTKRRNFFKKKAR